MDRKTVLHFVTFISLIVTTSSTYECSIENKVSSCVYTVKCIGQAGRISTPNCNYEDNVKFIITDSVTEFLTTGFFGSTNFDTRVRYFEAYNNVWTNLESMAFKYYYKSMSMNIMHNAIKIIKNDVFKNYVYLKYLNLSSNSIEELQERAFLLVDNIDSAKLEILDLSNNKLTKLNNEFRYIPKLSKLYLQKNNLHFLNDYIFNNVPELTILNLSYNRLYAINSTLINLKALKNVDISNNRIKELVGYEINRLLALEIFNASNNSIHTVESTCFNKASNLTIIDLSFNHINSTIKSDMFTACKRLEYLNYYNNHVMKIEVNSFKNNVISYFNFENNYLSGDIVKNTFSGLQNITKLDLSKQNISAIRNGAFLDMNSLLVLNLSDNKISEIEAKSFDNALTSILNISYNSISSLDFFQNSLTNLTELYLSHNNITFVLQHTFEKQPFLKVLDLSANKISIIEPLSLPLNNLQYFNLSNNSLTGVIKSSTFSPAKYLRSLDLSNFKITEIDERAFVDLPVLARLNLSNNLISKIHLNNFNGVDNIYSLDISNNNLSNLEFNNSVLNNLKAVYLNNNKLESISKIFTSVCKLLYLDISYNNISNVTGLQSFIFPNLTVLHLGFNNIENFNNPDTNTLSTLVDLGLSSNKIKHINLKYYKDLMSLDLRNNSLAFINASFFENVDHLQGLDVSNNSISEVPPGTFQNMKNLKLVNLSSNFLTQLRFGSFKGLHKAEMLDLSRNKLTSIDVEMFHECEKLVTLIIDYNYLKTFDVETLTTKYLRNLQTLSLGGNPISCKEIILNVKTGRNSRVEVTAIDKVYHEDNVHGIKCGDDLSTTTVSTTKSDKSVDASLSDHASYIVLAWCSVITLLLIGAGVAVYMKISRNNQMMALYPSRYRSSLEMEGVEFNSDMHT